jgi:hypothetical protein
MDRPNCLRFVSQPSLDLLRRIVGVPVPCHRFSQQVEKVDPAIKERIEFGPGNLSAFSAVSLGEPDAVVPDDRWLLSERPVALIWIRKGNCSNLALQAWLEPLWPDALKRLEQGEQFIELRA